MITTEKIEEWIREAEERPASAPLIIQHLANRLRDLAQRNEELLDENIALMTGKRVEEYDRRIAHLEYQLDLLKRQLSAESTDLNHPGKTGQTSVARLVETASVLVYDAQGHVARIVANQGNLDSSGSLAHLQSDLSGSREPPRLLAVPSSEELLLVFNSGRVATLPAEEISPIPVGEAITGDKIPIPVEPLGGESLVCLVPISKLSLINLLVQVSRKGYVKKISASMIETILANHYIGSGVMLPADQTFNVVLCRIEEQLILVSRLGHLLRIQARQLSHSIDEAMRMGKADHLVSAFVIHPGQSILIVTQGGKLIHRTEDSFELTGSLKTMGKPVFSKSRREQGVRIIGAAAVSEYDWSVALHKDGQLTLHANADLFASGIIPVQGELLAYSPLLLPGAEVRSSSEG